VKKDCRECGGWGPSFEYSSRGCKFTIKKGTNEYGKSYVEDIQTLRKKNHSGKCLDYVRETSEFKILMRKMFGWME